MAVENLVTFNLLVMLICFVLPEELCKTDFRTVTFESFESFQMFYDSNFYNSIRFIQKRFHEKTSLLSQFEVKMASSKSKGKKNIPLDKKNSSLHFEANVDH